jgi:beta-N-acetylhexosaminidase
MAPFVGNGHQGALSSVPSATPTVASAPLPLQTDGEIARALLRKMTLEQKLGQMVISEFYGATLSADVVALVKDSQIGGVLIENKNGNARTRPQLIGLNTAMQNQAAIPLFISTDFEGGLVNELRLITGPRPSEAAIGATGSTRVAYTAGRNAASDLSALGLNMNFMPIVDILTNANNPGLIDRTFGTTPTLVTSMGRAYLQGLTAGGVTGCLKHFPGLGSASVDPHASLPLMNRSLATLNALDLVPYRTLIAEGLVPMVMVTHILNPQLDPGLPTSLSPAVVTGLLRDQLHFKGVIISDTLWMGGISNTYSLAQAAILAINAGTNLLLGPRGLQETRSMLAALKQAVSAGTIAIDRINTSVRLILQMKLGARVLTRTQALRMIGNGNGPVTPAGDSGAVPWGTVASLVADGRKDLR